MDLTTGPILKKLLLFILPLMCSSVLQLLFNAADVVVVGRFAGDNSLAAVGSTGSLVGLFTNLFMGLSVGANVLVARNLGAKNEQSIGETVHTAILLGLLGGLILAAVGSIFARHILVLMRSPAEVIELSTLYLRIYFLGMPAMMLYNFGGAVLRAMGDTRRPLYYLLFAGVINVALNMFFVIVLKMDVAGVALATVISQVISAILVLRCLMREEGPIRLYLRKLRLHRAPMLEILRVGLPAGCQGIIFSLSNVVIQSSINGFGATVVAGNSAASNVEGFVYMAMNAIYQATISFTSQSFGAGDLPRIRRVLLTSQALVIVVGFLMGNLAVLFGEQLLGIYSDSEVVIQAGMKRLQVISATYFLCGIMDVMVGALRGIGQAIMPMLVCIVGVCGLRLAWLSTVFQVEQYHTVTTVYLSYPISWVITLSVHILCFVIAFRRLKRHTKPMNT